MNPSSTSPAARPDGVRFKVRAVVMVLTLLGVVSAGLAWFVWNRDSQRQSAPEDTQASAHQDWVRRVESMEAGYVGSHRCAECHSDLAETYAQHPMAHSVRRVRDELPDLQPAITEAFVPGVRTVLHTGSSGDQVTHGEQMYDHEGVLIYDQDFPMDFVVGAGDRGRAYLRQQGHLLLMSPLNWYPQQGRWGLAPNYQPDDVRRFDRRVLDSCLTCHAGRVAPAGRNTNTYMEEPFHEAGIGCERCHGPGREHVAYWEQTTTSGADPILKLAQLGTVERESICYQCHLSATRVLRPGRSHFDFRAGMKLSDVWCILDAGTDIDSQGRTRSVNHVQQMRSSRCFLQSDGKLTCFTCHSPHSVPAVADKPSYYRQRCLQCHATDDCNEPEGSRTSANDNCTQCHMPAARSSNMSHVAQTDHRLLRKPVELDESPHEDTLELEFFDRMGEEIPEDEQPLDLAIGAYSYLTQKGRPVPPQLADQLRLLANQFPQEGRLLHALGTLAIQRQQPRVAERYFKQAEQTGTEHEAVLQSLLELSYLQGNWPQAVAVASQLLEIDPSDFRLYAMRGDARAQLGDLPAGVADVEQAAALNPGEMVYREWLVRVYMQLAQSAAAEEHKAVLKRLQSARVPERLQAEPPQEPSADELP